MTVAGVVVVDGAVGVQNVGVAELGVGAGGLRFEGGAGAVGLVPWGGDGLFVGVVWGCCVGGGAQERTVFKRHVDF